MLGFAGPKLKSTMVMTELAAASTADLAARHNELRARYEAFRARGVKLDITRGKPAPEQLALSQALLSLPGPDDYLSADGGDCRNYFGSVQGLHEARVLLQDLVGAPPERMIVAGNSSLALMHDAILWALVHGMPGGQPWRDATFLCPAPGYDRHFAILEGLGIKMVPVPLTGAGPDMDVVERLAADPGIKGMWCVPKYSNPTAETYSDATVERLAQMKAAPDFRIFWDNAYAVHHLTDARPQLANLLDACARAGNPDRAFVFASTSKITFGGGGLGMLGTSKANLDWYLGHMSRRTIGPDKLNQLRHVRFFRDAAGIARHMEQQRLLLVPKFAAVYERFDALLGGTGAATWNRPDGGYFVNLDVRDGCAARVVALAKELGIAMVPAGRTFPYGKDPRDRNIRIAPTFPSLDEVRTAAEGVALCTLVAASEALLAQRAERVRSTASHQPA